MTEYLTVDGGTLAYEVTGGAGPLVVLAHGMGDSREAYRFLARAGGRRVPGRRRRPARLRRVQRGLGRPTRRTDIAGDLIALVRPPGRPGGAGRPLDLRWRRHHRRGDGAGAGHRGRRAGAVHPRADIALGDLRVARFRRGMLHLLGTGLFGSVGQWSRYLDVAYPGPKPADWDARLARIDAMLREPGRMKALQQMGRSGAGDAGAQLGNVRCPVLVVQGTLDPDWADPQAEGEAIVAALPPGLGRLEMIEGAGHYPHVQFPEQVVCAGAAVPGVRPCLGPASTRPPSSRPARRSPTRSASRR